MALPTHAIIALASLLALAGCADASADAPASTRVLDAVAERTDLDDAGAALHVRWRTDPAGAPVDLLVASSPHAEPSAMTTLATGLGTGEWRGVHPERSYFLIRPTDAGTGVRVAPRVLPLAGGRNFRDLGGYQTADGRRVRWGALFRSGTMAGFTAADQRFLDALDARVIVDFRSVEERAAEPTTWAADDPEIWSRDYASAETESGLRDLLASGEITAERTRAAMTTLYHEIADQQAPAYRELFDRLAAGQTPLVFNCSAGKDRTGVAAALVLTALGVPRETVIEDYALSDQVVDYAAAFELDSPPAEDDPYAFLRRLPRETVMPLMASDPAYLRAALETIEAEHGSVDAYLREVLDVTDAERAAIRAALLEPAG